MPITPKNIVQHELIGLYAKVVAASNPANVGIEGKIIDETYHTLLIETKKGRKRVFKKALVFKVSLPDKRKVEIDGDLLVSRPWDRIKKRFPKI